MLLVEDDEGDAFLVRELLARGRRAVRPGGRAARLREARRADRAASHCVLLDLGPARRGGHRRPAPAARRCAGSAAVCVLTGRSDEHLGVAAVAEGAQDYLVKGQVDGVAADPGAALRGRAQARRRERPAAARGRSCARPSRPGWSAACCPSR